MATKKKSTKTKKKTQSKSTAKSKISKAKKSIDFSIPTISDEAVSLTLVCVGFLLFFSVFINDSFILTNFFKTLSIILFGYVAYIIPIIILIIGSYTFITKKSIDTKKLILNLFLTLSLCSLSHVLINNSLTPNIYLFSNPNFNIRSGGIIGMIFGGVFLTLIGKFLSSIFLIIVNITLIVMLLSKNFDDIKILLLAIYKNIKNLYFLIRQKIDESLTFDEQNYEYENKDYSEKDIVFDQKLSTNDTINISINEKNLDDLKTTKDIDISKRFGIKRKREPKVSENNNKKDRNRSQNREQKPNIQLNMRKMNPFAKKTKVKLFDFSGQLDDQIQRPLKNIDSFKSQNDESYLINMRGKPQKQQITYAEDAYDDTFENNFIEPTESAPKINSTTIEDSKIAEYEETIKTLKHELDRQMFLFQDSQKEFQTQKNVEKNLLKIINAQRETIEKQASAIKAFELSLNVINTNTQKTSLDQETGYEPLNTNTTIYHEDELIEKDDETLDTSSIYEDFDEFTNNIKTDTNRIDFETYDNSLELSAEEETPEDDPDLIDTQTISYEDEPSHEDLQNLTKGLVSDINIDYVEYNNAEAKDVYELNNTIDINVSPIENSNNSIFKSDSSQQYTQPIKSPVSEKREKHIYTHPTVDFLVEKPNTVEQTSKIELIANSKKLESTLRSFGVVATVNEVSKGPSVTRYEIQPGPGVKVSKIANLSDDLALNLAAKSIRIQAPIPGKRAVGIEVPNETTEMVYLREVLDDENFKNFKSKLAFGIGKDISGKIVVADLATMPHLLIAGATGAGKSVCVNTLITSIIYKSSPDEVKLLMIDPKVVELSVYNGIPHLLIPVVTDPKKASASLNWAVREMEKRYKLFADKNVRDLKGYNSAMALEDGPLEPQIVIIIDELADLMMTASKEVEAAIIRIAQMARAAGIHLIIATQRPTADVITGLIKSNIPSRLAFSVSSGLDSKIILDETGAEKLLGKGDMLFKPMGSPEPYRIQGAFISDKEVESIVSFLKTETDPEDMREIIEEITSSANPQSSSNSPSDTVDEIFEDVVDFIITKQKASTSLIQRQFRVGFNRAARIIDELENFGVIGPDEGNKPRKVLMSMSEWNNKFRT